MTARAFRTSPSTRRLLPNAPVPLTDRAKRGPAVESNASVAPAFAAIAPAAAYHRLTEAREIDGRLRPAGTILDWQGTPQPFLEPLDVPAHGRWVAAFPAAARPVRD